MNQLAPDSLIFDMDGTLWDATDSYLACWNLALKARNIDKVLDRATLDGMMGWEQKKVFSTLFPEKSQLEQEELMIFIASIQDEHLPILGGRLYDGVYEGLKMLSKKYKLFIVSNCPAFTIKQMIKWAKIEEFITDEFAHGVNYMPKSNNINLLIDKYSLINPVYIGDTDGDSKQSELAGLPFIFVNYGFGTTNIFSSSFDSFHQLTNYFMKKI